MSIEPRATYRFQLRPGLGFDEAARRVAYLDALGVSHLYASPSLTAVRGSTHGYDVVDPSRINTELGGAEAYDRMCQALARHGLGQLLDIVPNHMAIPGPENPWWWDVLENGPSSQYASYFDVDWEHAEARLHNKVMLPVLEDHYGRVLEAGKLAIVQHGGTFVVRSNHHNTWPMDPRSTAPILEGAAARSGSETCAFLAGCASRLPRSTSTRPGSVERRHQDKAVLCELLARLVREDNGVATAIEAEVAAINRDPERLHALIEEQNWRLAYWRAAGWDLGYRRFFDITTLAGLRIEDSEVFHAAHQLIVRLVAEGKVDGLRVDHPDGLRDPTKYFQRLRTVCPGTWVVAEKILESGETLPREWAVDGTTGYDFANLATGLFIDPRGEDRFTEGYHAFIGKRIDWRTLVVDCKREVVSDLLGSDLNRLTALFVDICEAHRRHRDYTRNDLREALREVAAEFDVYRTYVRPGMAISPEDATRIEEATERANAARPDLDPELFAFLRDILLLRISGDREHELALRFQQLTGPTTAKGVEDTAFYRYHRFIALNEVGGAPDRFGVSPEAFHAACRETAATHPKTLLTTSTHDAKRSEDVRCRLAVLSELPERWLSAVRRWSERAAAYWQDGYRDRNIEYLLFQTWVGAWPIDLERMLAFAEKAAREAKVHTSWTRMDGGYEAALAEFIRRCHHDRELMADIERLVREILLPGRINSLAQVLLRHTAPGVGDVYQGSELWTLRLVDPDNRCPVDFELQSELLRSLEGASPETVLARMDEGVPKLWTLRQALHARRARPRSFADQHEALPVHGARAGHAIAYLRGHDVVVVVPRLVYGLAGRWHDTVLELPEGTWRNWLTHELVHGGSRPMSELFQRFPVALLVREDG